MSMEHRTTADLREYLHAVDLAYFDGHLEELGVEIRWMRCRDRSAPKRVGTYQADKALIEIARHLAVRTIPRFYVMYVVFHEACHAVYDPTGHGRAFTIAEKQFLFHYEVAQWLELDEPWPEAPKGLR